MGWVYPWRLRRAGILGMNARNHNYILKYNQRQFYPRVDDKQLTKKLVTRAGLAAPALIGAVRYQYQTKKLQDLLSNHHEFVIKPTQGAGGKGILVIISRRNGQFIKSSGAALTMGDLNRHVLNILSGLYSLGGQTDTAMVEQIIHFSELFEGYSYQGVPDIRIIVFMGYPIMAMMRLPTSRSDGKANLHQGAVGVGIDITTGLARHAVQNDRRVHQHPDTKQPFRDLAVPRWEEHLLLASRCYEVTGLGYFGADIVFDRDRGPMILELNARPGLAIQIANGLGLLPRLKRVESLDVEAPARSPQQRVDWVKAELAAEAPASESRMCLTGATCLPPLEPTGYTAPRYPSDRREPNHPFRLK